MSELKTVNIKGKEYVEVNQRILYFRNNEEKYPKGKIITSIESMQDGVCVIRAEVYIDNELVSTGHAYEKEGSTFINKTSYLENCETSAIGRALGILGIGIDTSIASSEEVGNAIAQQNDQKSQGLKITLIQKDRIIKLVQDGKIDLQGLLAHYKVSSVDELNHIQAEQIIKAKGGN